VALLARYLGAAALLAVGLDHLEQRSAAHYAAIPTIGTLFLLNFVSATVLAREPPLHLGDVLATLAGGPLSPTIETSEWPGVRPPGSPRPSNRCFSALPL
jgi:hypothetical protein